MNQGNTLRGPESHSPARQSISKRVRYEVLRRDGHTCRYCGASAPDVKLTIDHVIPVALGGTNTPSNLVTACVDCNAGKASTSPDSPLVADVSEEAERWARVMALAAAEQRAERDEVHPLVEHLDTEWNRWECGGKPIDRSYNWEATVVNHAAAGIDEDDVSYAVDVTMRADQVLPSDKWLYYCGVIRRMLADRMARAAEITARQREFRPYHDDDYRPNPELWPHQAQWCPCEECEAIREAHDLPLHLEEF